jgi:foldase protein PrsA
MKKMGAAPRAVSVSPAEIMAFAFQDKSPAVIGRLDQLIQERAIAQEAKKQGISLTPAEVSAQVTKLLGTVRKQFPALPGKPDSAVYSTLGIRPAYLRGYATTVGALEKLIRKETETKLGHPIGPGDFLKASHILVRVTTAPTEAGPNGQPAKSADNDKAWAEGKQKVEGILADIRSGKTTFEQAAQANNEDQTKFNGGSLGVFVRGQMVPEFDKAAFTLEKGKVSEPVRTLFGWHLIRVDKPGSELTAPEREQVLQQQLQGKIQAKVQEIMSKAKVDNKIKPAAMPGLNLPGNTRPVDR